MKKQLLLWVLASCCFAASAQKAYLFKIKLLPRRSYQSTQQTRLIDLKADSLPIAKDMTSVLAIETGAQGTTHAFPLTFKQTIAELKMFGRSSNFDPEILNGRMIEAHSDANGEITVDPNGGVSGESGKGMALNELNQYQWIIFPEKPLKTGDSFTCSKPMNLPFNNSLVTIITTYKLVAVKNNLAYFELKNSCAIDLMDESNNAKLQGMVTGTGELVFDLALSYPQSMSDELNIDFTAFRTGKSRQIKCSLFNSSVNKVTVSTSR